MILVEQIFEDGTTIKGEFKSIKTAKKQPVKKKSPLKLLKVLELVTGVVLAIIPIITNKK